jgi:hypothetical protein
MALLLLGTSIIASYDHWASEWLPEQQVWYNCQTAVFKRRVLAVTVSLLICGGNGRSAKGGANQAHFLLFYSQPSIPNSHTTA